VALIVYVGAHDCVDVQVSEPRPFAVTAYRGTPVDVPADIAPGLLDQPVNWQPAVVLSKSKRGEPATTEEEQ
jgi:hypothetical protein